MLIYCSFATINLCLKLLNVNIYRAFSTQQLMLMLITLLSISVDGNFFQNEMKDGGVSALFKNSNSFHEKNYRPITVLPSISKIFERLLAKQMLLFVNKFLSPKICGYRQGNNTQHALIKLVETCKKTLNNKG